MANIANRVSSIVAEKYQRVNNTFVREAKPNPKDLIQVEIGDSKQPDFKPQFKFLRWDNEINFSLRAQEHPSAEVRTEGEKIKYVTPEYEVHMYDKPEAGEDGGFEFEWVLPEKPSSNVLTSTIQTKGLNFYYQPALTQEEIDEGAFRPENVVGSYAVYHATKGGMNRADGMEYKVGKAFHIYRPKVTDASGNETWGELHIDEENGLLSVTIDQAWLDSAVYPVVVDPTFGYTSAGASETVIANASSDISRRVGNSETYSGGAGTIDSITSHIRTSGSVNRTLDVSMFLNIEDSGVNSHALLVKAESSPLSVTSPPNWYTINAAGESIVNDDYILNIVGDGEDVPINTVSVSFDSVETGKEDYIDQIAGSGGYSTMSNENPWTVTGSGSGTEQRHSIYATYTASGGEETVVKDLIGVGLIPFPR